MATQTATTFTVHFPDGRDIPVRLLVIEQWQTNEGRRTRCALIGPNTAIGLSPTMERGASVMTHDRLDGKWHQASISRVAAGATRDELTYNVDLGGRFGFFVGLFSSSLDKSPFAAWQFDDAAKTWTQVV